jgi:glycerol-3-phosphate dehydrogenase (NAD(P)+)
MTRGLAEMTRLGVALGAQVETFSGLSGLGDLMVTCMSQHSRNRGVGERLGKGESLEEIMEGMQMVAEGVWNCRAACSLGASVGIDLPIAEQVQAVVHEGVGAREAMIALMERAPRSEAE